jgi:ribosomal protein L21
MISTGIKFGKEQSNILAYVDDILLIGNNEIETRYLFVEKEKVARQLGLQIKQEKTKHMIMESKNTLKQNIGHFKIQNYKS